MPSVHRHARTFFWQGSFVDEKGRRRMRSTKEKDRAAAVAVVERWQREAYMLAAGPDTPLALPNS